MSNKGIAIFSALALLAACSRSKSMDEQMRKDLEAASASTFELPPSGGGQKVVSAVEQTGRPQSNERTAHGPSESPPPPSQSEQRHDSSRTETVTGPAATKPLPASSVSKPPPGGYKTMDEVLRKAPFPIKP